MQRALNLLYLTLYKVTNRFIMKKLLLSLALTVAVPLGAEAKPVQDFDSFLSQVADEVKAKGLDPKYMYEALGDNPQPNQRLVKSDKNQPEFKITFNEYISTRVSPWRKKKGAEMKQKHLEKLTEVSKSTGVPMEVVLSLWGHETSYGTYPLKLNAVNTLATLAYLDKRRQKFWHSELHAAVEVLNKGYIAPKEMKSSWAGALGQCQFMPSNVLALAKDGNDDGKIDIWNTEADVFASAANYLKKRTKWEATGRGYDRVYLSKRLPKLKMRGTYTKGWKTVAQWQKLGVLPVKETELAALDVRARLFMPEGPSKKVYLIYDNFFKIMDWNRSTYFAFSVLTLAKKLGWRG